MAKKKKGNLSLGAKMANFQKKHGHVTSAGQQSYLRQRAKQPIYQNRTEKKVFTTAHKVYKKVSHVVQKSARAYNRTPEAKYRRQLLNRNDAPSKAGRKIVRGMTKSKVGRATLGALKSYTSGVTYGAGDLSAKLEGYKNVQDYRNKNIRYKALQSEQEKKLEKSKSYQVGSKIGDIASYATGYSAIGKAAAKKGAKLAASKVGKAGVEAASEAGAKELGRATTKAAAKSASKVAAKQSEEVAGKAAKATAKKSGSLLDRAFGAAEKKATKAVTKAGSSKISGKIIGKTARADVKAEIRAEAKRSGKRMTRKELEEATAKRISKMTGKEARKYTRRAAERITKEIGKDVFGDATVGASMDVANEIRNGNTPMERGKDGKLHFSGRFAKDMAENAAGNIAIGGAMDTLPGVARNALGNLRGVKGKTKIVKRLGKDGRVHRVRVAVNEGEEAVTHAGERARHSEAGKKGVETRRRNLVKKKAAAEEAEWHGKPADDLGPAAQRYARAEDKRNLHYRSKAEPFDIDTPRHTGKSFRETARERLTQREAFKDKRSVAQTVEKRAKSPASMLREEDFVEHLRDSKINARTLAERAAKNGTTPGEELTKEHQKFRAEQLRAEYEAKKAGEATVSKAESVQQGAGESANTPRYSKSIEVDNNLSDEAVGYLKQHNLTAEDITPRTKGMSDTEYSEAVDNAVYQRINSDNNGAAGGIDEAVNDYKAIGAEDRRTVQAASVPEPGTKESIDQGAQIAKAQAEMQANPHKEYKGETPEEKAANERALRNIEVSDVDENIKKSERLLFMPGKSLKEKVHRFFTEATKAMVDSAVGVERAAKKFGDRMLSVRWNDYVNRVSKINEAVNGEGVFRLNDHGEMEHVSKSLRQCLEPVAKEGEETLKDYYDYLDWRCEIDRAKHRKPVHLEYIKELADQAGIKPKPRTVGPNKEWVATYPQEVYARLSEIAEQKANELLAKHPNFKVYEQDLRTYIHEINMMRVDSGVWSHEDLAHWEKENPHYIPTHRTDLEVEGGKATAKGQSESTTLSSGTGIKTATGSERNRIPLQNEMQSWTAEAINGTTFNDFAVKLMDDLPSDDALLDIHPVDASKVKGDEAFEFKKGQNGEGRVDPGKIRDNGKGGYAMIARKGGVAYEFTINKDIFDAVRWQQKPLKDWHIKKVNDLFRNLVTTWNPGFGPANGLRDFQDAPSYSQYGEASFLKNYNRAIGLMASGDKLWKVFKNLSGASSDLLDITKEISEKGIKKLQRDTGTMGKIAWAAKAPVQKVIELNEAIEQIPRFAEFLTTIEKETAKNDGKLTTDILHLAAYNGQEITENFSRSGYFGKWLNANGVTFLNAGIQDVNRTVKALTTSKKTAFRLLRNAVFFGIAPSVINEILVGDDPDYQRIRTADKDLYYFIPTGNGKFIRLPKGRVVGTIASPVQRLVRDYRGNTDKREKWTDDLAKTAVEQLAPNNPAESNLFAPIMQAELKDKNDQGKTWYGSPIVSSSLKDKPQDEQYNENTTELAKWLGKKLNKSPQKIDYILKQESGVIGQMLPSIPKIGSIAKTGNGDGAKNTLKAFGKLFTNRFYQDTATNNKRSTQFYDRLDTLKENSNSNKATQYDKMVYSFMNKQSGELGAYNDKINKIEGDKSLTADEKLKQIRKIRLKQTKATEKAMDMENDYKSAYNQLKDKFSVKDYKKYKNPKQQMRKELNAAIERKVAIKNGANPVEYDFNQLSEDQRKGWKPAKKAGLSKKQFMKYKVESEGAGQSTLAKTFAAVDSGAKNQKQAAALVSKGKGKIDDDMWQKVHTLKKSGIGMKNIRKYQKYNKGVQDSNYAAHAYAAIKAGADNQSEAIAISGQNIYGTTWETAVYAYKHGVKMKEMKHLFSDKTIASMSKIASNGRPFRTKQGVYNWIMKHHGNDSLAKKRMYWSIYAYRNWHSMF